MNFGNECENNGDRTGGKKGIRREKEYSKVRRYFKGFKRGRKKMLEEAVKRRSLFGRTLKL